MLYYYGWYCLHLPSQLNQANEAFLISMDIYWTSPSPKSHNRCCGRPNSSATDRRDTQNFHNMCSHSLLDDDVSASSEGSPGLLSLGAAMNASACRERITLTISRVFRPGGTGPLQWQDGNTRHSSLFTSQKTSSCVRKFAASLG